MPDAIALPLAVLPGEDIYGMLATHLFEDRLGHVVQGDDPCLPVLASRGWQYEHTPKQSLVKLGRLKFSAYLFVDLSVKLCPKTYQSSSVTTSG